MPGTLYVIATPIGNLEDLSPRVARILAEVSMIAAEDTRQTRKLLSHLGLHTKLTSYNEHNAAQRTPGLLKTLLRTDVALVTDAGAPGISDPGAALVERAAEQGTPVVPIPGPSAVTTALSASGMPADTFRFAGFPPRARKARRAAFEAMAGDRDTQVLFEAPHRLRATLEDLAAVLGERPIAVCRELTKLHEEIFRGTPAEALAHFTEPRGEIVIVVAGAPARAGEDEADLDAARDALARLKAEGATQRDAAAQVTAAYGISRREAYRIWLSL